MAEQPSGKPFIGDSIEAALAIGWYRLAIVGALLGALVSRGFYVLLAVGVPADWLLLASKRRHPASRSDRRTARCCDCGPPTAAYVWAFGTSPGEVEQKNPPSVVVQQKTRNVIADMLRQLRRWVLGAPTHGDEEAVMDSVALMKQVIASTDKVVKGTDASQLGLPSPCTEWTVRDVINHITGGATMFAVCVEQGSVPDDLLGKLMGGDNLGDDYVGAWESAASRAIAAFEAPGALDKTVTLPFGQMPAGIALNIAVFDVLTHAADIASATSQTIDDTALVETALEVGHQMVGPDLRVPGVFGPEQPAPEGATPTVRLLAFAGRKV